MAAMTKLRNEELWRLVGSLLLWNCDISLWLLFSKDFLMFRADIFHTDIIYLVAEWTLVVFWNTEYWE